jgi:hypothetical protein
MYCFIFTVRSLCCVIFSIHLALTTFSSLPSVILR